MASPPLAHTVWWAAAPPRRRIDHVAGAVMIADILTKAPARCVFNELMMLILRYAKDGVVVYAAK